MGPPGGLASINFILTDTLTQGGTCAAKFLKWNSEDESDDTMDFPDDLEVWDRHGMFSGTAGARGMAIWAADANRWQIWQLTCGG